MMLGKIMKLLWKVYFFIIALQVVGFPASLILLAGPLLLIDAVNWIFILFGVVGLFGYVFTKNIGSKKIWRIFLFGFIAWDIFNLLLWQPSQSAVNYDERTWAITLILFAFLIPQYMGIYRYAFNDHSVRDDVT